jgi:hypothetical protein
MLQAHQLLFQLTLPRKFKGTKEFLQFDLKSFWGQRRELKHQMQHETVRRLRELHPTKLQWQFSTKN